jgi:nucleoside-diphosphate-sugar epimerase
MTARDTSRVLVTGGTGFIGGNLVRALLGEGRTVRALVRNPSRAANIEGAELFRGDLLEPESLAGIERDVDIVVHCAGILGKWGTSRSRLRAVNVQGTLSLLERFRDGALHRFVHLSAGGVSGPVRQSRGTSRPSSSGPRSRTGPEIRTRSRCSAPSSEAATGTSAAAGASTTRSTSTT